VSGVDQSKPPAILASSLVNPPCSVGPRRTQFDRRRPSRSHGQGDKAVSSSGRTAEACRIQFWSEPPLGDVYSPTAGLVRRLGGEALFQSATLAGRSIFLFVIGTSGPAALMGRVREGLLDTRRMIRPCGPSATAIASNAWGLPRRSSRSPTISGQEASLRDDDFVSRHTDFLPERAGIRTTASSCGIRKRLRDPKRSIDELHAPAFFKVVLHTVLR